MNLNGKEYFYIRNVQNDVIGLHDSEGKVVVNYSYDTWGNIVSISGSLKDSVGKKNPYRYRGYRYDEETGLYYLQSRYYNGSWGRFINADALIGQPGDILSFNMFAYCGNNPVIMEDPNGYRFDITGGHDNGKYISMAIQSQYPAIAKNVANRKPIPKPKPKPKPQPKPQPKSNKNNEIIKSIKKDVTATAIDETLKELPKVGKVMEKLSPVGNYFKYEGIYGDMKTCKLTSFDSFRWDNLATFGAMTMFDIGVGGLTAVITSTFITTFALSGGGAIAAAVIIAGLSAGISTAIKNELKFEQIVK